MRKENLTENKAESTPTGGVLVGKREGQTMIHNKGSLSGYLVGKTHAEGGIKAINKSTGQPLEMQGGEVVITAPAVSDNTKREFEGKMLTNREILSEINSRGGGVSFAESGMEVPKSIKHTGASYKYGGKTMTDHEIMTSMNGGGHLAEGFSLRDIADIHQVPLAELKKQVKSGMEAESEHTSSKREQMKIVKDHLFENPKYYTLLKKAGLEHGGDFESLYENENDYIKYLVAFNLADGVESYKLKEYLKSKGLSSVGLLPENVRTDAKYRKLKSDFDIAFKRLQNLPKFKYPKNRDRVQESKDRKKAKEISDKIIQIKLKNESFENGGANEIGGTFNIKNQFDSFTTIKVMPIDENLRVSKDFFSVKITVRAKSGNDIKIQEKPLVTYPISKYDSFMEDLYKRNPTKFKKGGEVVNLVKDAKNGNSPSRDLNNYNDLLDVQVDGAVGGDSGIYVNGGAVGYDFTFLKSNPMQRARAITVLEKKIRHDGNIMSNYEFLEQLPKGLEVGVSKLFSRKSEKGYVEKLSIGDFIVDSKAEIDYYQYLQNGGYPYSKYIVEVREAETKKSEADKIVRNEQQRLREISDIENYKNSEIAKRNQIKELIEKGADAIIKKMNAPRLMQIEKYKTQRQTNDVKQDIDYHTRMIEQTERQVNNAYDIASKLYEIIDGEVQPKFDWSIGDKVKVGGYINNLPAEIETEVVELKENRFGEIAYRVESKEGIANSWISYDGLYPLIEVKKSTESDNNEYEYVLTVRPFDIGTYPKDNFLRFTQQDFQYGVVAYSKPLPINEIEHYSLCPITEIKDYDGKTLDYKIGNLILKARVKLESDKRRGYFVNLFISDDKGIMKTQPMSGAKFLSEIRDGKLKLENEMKDEPKKTDVEITTGYFKVDSENTGFEYAKKINNYFNKWNKIKTLKDKLNFERLDVPMFGSFENESVLSQIEHFEKIGFELGANEVVRNDFKKEVKKIIDKKIFDREMDKRRYPKEEQEVDYKKEKSFESEGSTEGKGKLYEFFTPQVVADKMLALAQHYGFKGGNVLEPATGSGRLIKNLKDTNITAFEISKDNFEILKREFPNAELYNFNFEKAFLKEPRFNTLLNRKGTETWLKNAPFDLVVANPPYGKFSGLYSSYFNFKGQVEHFFILQSLHLLKKGGLGVYLIPSSFMRNGIAYNDIKKQIFEIAELVDAYRLPSNIFEKTQIGTDILILRKK